MPKLKIPKVVGDRKNKEKPTPAKEEREAVLAKAILSLEIDSSGIEMAIVSKEKNKLQILDAEYFSFESGNIYSNTQSNEFSDLVKKGYEKISLTNQLPIKDMIVGISAKNLYNKTSTVRIKRKDPETKITKSEIAGISEKIITRTKMEIEEKYKLADNLELLNSDTTFAKVDGYITKNLEGFRGSTLEISTFMSFIDKKVLDSILSLSKTLKLNLITITPTIYTVNKLLKREDRQNYILVDIGGRNTSIAVVFAGEISIITSFSMGLKSFYTYIKERAHTSEGDVIQTLKGDQISENIENFKREIVEVWAETLKNSLGFIEEIKIYPEQILIHGLGSNIVDRREITSKILQLKFKDTPTIKKITIDDLEMVENLSENKQKETLINSAGLSNFGFKLTENE